MVAQPQHLKMSVAAYLALDDGSRDVRIELLSQKTEAYDRGIRAAIIAPAQLFKNMSWSALLSEQLRYTGEPAKTCGHCTPSISTNS